MGEEFPKVEDLLPEEGGQGEEEGVLGLLLLHVGHTLIMLIISGEITLKETSLQQHNSSTLTETFRLCLLFPCDRYHFSRKYCNMEKTILVKTCGYFTVDDRSYWIPNHYSNYHHDLPGTFFFFSRYFGKGKGCTVYIGHNTPPPPREEKYQTKMSFGQCSGSLSF